MDRLADPKIVARTDKRLQDCREQEICSRRKEEGDRYHWDLPIIMSLNAKRSSTVRS